MDPGLICGNGHEAPPCETVNTVLIAEGCPDNRTLL